MQDDSALPIVALPQDLTSLQDELALPILAPSHELPSSQDEGLLLQVSRSIYRYRTSY